MKHFKTAEHVSDSVRPVEKRPLLKSFAVGIFASAVLLSGSFSVYAETQGKVARGLEKEDLKFGFIKLTDMAPLAIAYEKGYFEDEGLYVTLEAQANWKVLLDGVIDG